VTGARRGESEIEKLGRVDGEKQGVDFGDKVKHIESSDQIFVTRTM